MKRATLALAALLLALAPGAFGQEARGQEAKGARPPADFKIGVVDLGKVFASYKKTKDFEQRFNDERDKLKKELDELRKQINEASKELEMLDQSSEAYSLKEEERKILAARFELKKERLQTTVRKRFDEYRLQILDDIQSVVKAFGEEQHFTLILKVQGTPSAEEVEALGALNLEALKGVLYYAGEVDITQPVVDILNRRYDLNPSAAPPQSASTATPPSPGAAAPAPRQGK